MGGPEALDIPVYCIIDGMARYEQPRWQDDLELVVETLRTIVNDDQLLPCFKLLVTGPQRVKSIDRLLGLPPNRRLHTNSRIMDDGPFSEGGVEQALQWRRMGELSGRSGTQYGDDAGWTADDYS
jgi:hypothetical protein